MYVRIVLTNTDVEWVEYNLVNARFLQRDAL